MLVKFGGGIVGASGSVAGNTYSRNRFGAYVRARTKPVNPQSPRQTVARARVSFLAEEWSDTLTAPQRLAWETYAAAIGWTNRLGEVVHLTGFNHYVRSNAMILAVGGTPVADGPTVLSLPNQDPTVSVALSAASGVTVTFDDSLDWVDESAGFLAVDLGQPQLLTRNFFAGPYRFDAAVQGDDTTPPTTPDGPTASSTWTLIAGQKVWTRFAIIREDGRATNKFGATPVIVGA